MISFVVEIAMNELKNYFFCNVDSMNELMKNFFCNRDCREGIQ